MTQQKDNEPVIVYTDGGAAPNPGHGGWAAVLSYKGKVREISGGEAHTTNNRMELTAACEALETLKRPCKVEMHTDSEYVKKGISEWIAGWKRKGWRSAGKDIKNRDLWERLDAATQRHQITWKWVRGHAGDPMNELCDELCGHEIQKQRELTR